MKLVRLIGTQFQDLFGVVTLKPGDNEVSDADWAKVRELKLGEMDIPFVEWARRQGSLHFEPDSADAPQVVTFPPAGQNMGHIVDVVVGDAAVEPVAEFDDEAMTLEHKGETLDVVAVGFADPDAAEPAPSAEQPAQAPKRRGRPPKNKPQA